MDGIGRVITNSPTASVTGFPDSSNAATAAPRLRQDSSPSQTGTSGAEVYSFVAPVGTEPPGDLEQWRFEGQATLFKPHDGPCYRCLFPQPPPPELAPSCAEGGVLGVLPGVIGSLQASEAIKLALGIGEPLIGRLLLFDALTTIFTEVALRRDPDCPVCGEHPTITEYVDYVEFCNPVRA